MTVRTLIIALSLSAMPVSASASAEPLPDDPAIADAAPDTVQQDPAAPPAALEDSAHGMVDTDAGAPSASAAVAPAPIVANPAITDTDAETEKKLANVRVVTVRNLARSELAVGMPIYEAGSKLIGKIAGFAGNDVLVDGAEEQFRVPLVSLYAYNVGGVDYIASRQTRSDLRKGG